MAGTADQLYSEYDDQGNNGQQFSQMHNGSQQQHARLSWPPVPSSTHQHSQGMTVHSSASPQMNMNAFKRSSSPLPLPMGGQHAYPDTSATATQLMSNWQMGNAQMPAVTLGLDTSSAFQPAAFNNTYGDMSFEASPLQTSAPEYMSQQAPSFMGQNLVDQSNLDQQGLDMSSLSGLNTMDNTLMNFSSDLGINNLTSLPIDWHNVDTSIPFYPSLDATAQLADLSGHHHHQNTHQHHHNQPFHHHGSHHQHHHHHHHHQQSLSAGSPSENNYTSDFDVKSLSSSENGSSIGAGWSLVVNPQETLHHRSPSDSSTDMEQPRNSYDSHESYMDLGAQLNSPSSESGPDSVYSDPGLFANNSQKPSPPPALQTTTTKPMPMRRRGSRKSPISPGTGRCRISKPANAKNNSSSVKNPAALSRTLATTTAGATATAGAPATAAAAAVAAAAAANVTTGGKEEGKRVGKRKGPLSANQRKQASEIRKLGACIRCRFLKKTCDKGDPCAGCQPSHARLWLVPCTRIDIKDLGYFLKGWKADYERHVTLSVSITNVKGFSDSERPLLVTHGYGHYLPIKAREVYVRDESVFGVDWVEAHSGSHEDFKVDTARLSAGADGVSSSMLSEYLDMHIDGGFEYFVDEHFQGTPFITEMLKIAYRFYTKEKTPVIRKALKLVLAYNLTQAILLVKGFGVEEEIDGKIDDTRSEFNGETAAPMMINFQVKTAMADLWRELQKSLLEDLSQLYSSIYSRDKLKHWPTIFMIASVLLVVWEEMQFDCRYRVPDEKAVDKFCHDMESTPVGVIVGLFSAISQKVPAFHEWETTKHRDLLGWNTAVSDAMEEVRDGIKKHERYLRNRNQAKFDRNDFDSLSNMFVSKLVIRAH